MVLRHWLNIIVSARQSVIKPEIFAVSRVEELLF